MLNVTQISPFDPKVVDIVLTSNDAPWGTWLIGKIIKLKSSENGRIQPAVSKISNWMASQQASETSLFVGKYILYKW